MATIDKHHGKWRARVRTKTTRATAVFDTYQDAKMWAAWKEAQIAPEPQPTYTLNDAITRYCNDILAWKRPSPAWRK